jgi:hypothetical protein
MSDRRWAHEPLTRLKGLVVNAHPEEKIRTGDITSHPSREGLTLGGVVNQRVSLGQANGPDVELIVTGTELYHTYQTVEGFPVVYDDDLGLFCFARVFKGKYESTAIPITSAPPPDVEQHAKESDAVRIQKIESRRSQMEQRSRAPGKSPSKEED